MSKSVLLSIQPYWVFLIVAKSMGWNINKEKTIEVRKSYPKDENWDKVIKIYCGKDKKSFAKIPKEYQSLMKQYLGKVIGEFVCDKIITDRTFGHDPVFNVLSCMSDAEIASYCTENEMYGLHISDLVIYDKPKELREFKKINRDCWYANLGLAKRDCPECKNADCFFTRPPQSWCYVEELI